MSNIRPIIINFLLVSIFAVAIITGGISVALLNNSPQNIGDSPLLSTYLASINASLSQAQTNSQAFENALSNSSVTVSASFPVIDAIKGAWKIIIRVPKEAYNLTIALVGSLFGSPFAIIISIISSIVIITIMLAIWKLVSTGESG